MTTRSKVQKEGFTMVELRPARPYDWPDIEDLLLDSTLALGLSKECVKYAVVAEEAGTFVGAAIVELFGDFGILRAVAVHLDWQGHGVGTALVARAVAHSEVSGVSWLFASRAGNEGFLSAAGFQRERPDLLPEAASAALGDRASEVMSLRCPTALL